MSQTLPHSLKTITVDCEHPDQPHHGNDALWQLLRVLSRAEVTASFFLQGTWVLANPELARAIANDGHEIGNHGHWHARLPLYSDQGLRRDLQLAEDAIRVVTGVDPKPWLRPPHGDGIYDPRVVGIAEDLGYSMIHWDVDSNDWQPEQTPRSFEAQFRSRRSGIILMHGWPLHNPAGLDRALQRQRAEGVTFVTLAEMAKFSPSGFTKQGAL